MLTKRFKTIIDPELFFFFLALAMVVTGCKKNIDQVTSIPVTNNQAKSGPIPAYVFNWETATFMPSAPSSTFNPVPMPWNSGTTAIDPNIAGDYLYADGWRLVWNTFSPTTILGDPNYTYFFGLYNRYRGLLRLYLWHPGSAIATSYINHGLSLYTTGTTSTMLNFNATEIVDASTPQITFSQVLKQQLTSAGGTWLVFQYEIAYDASIAATTFNTNGTFGISWKPQWVNVSNINLNGTEIGTIEGYIGTQNESDVDFNQVLQNGAMTVVGGLFSYSSLSSMVLGSGLTPWKNALEKGLSGVVEGFLSGSMGGSSTTPQAVQLTINTKINLSGNQITNGAVVDKKLVIPGQANSQTADGNIPYYNEIMGVFNISNRPTVYRSTVQHEYGPFEDPQWGTWYYDIVNENYYTLDNNSFTIIWNPIIINNSSTGATIQNLRMQTGHLIGYAQYFGGGISYGGYGIDGTPESAASAWAPAVINGSFASKEHIGNNVGAFGFFNSSIPLRIAYDTDFGLGGTTVVRIVFDLVPNDGAPPITFVKSFLANVIDQ